MLRTFRFSLLVAILSIAVPSLSKVDHCDQEKTVSTVSTYKTPLAYSGSFFEIQEDQQDSEELALGFSHPIPRLNFHLVFIPSQDFRTSSFLSQYWGRLQFLNIPPPVFLA